MLDLLAQIGLDNQSGTPKSVGELGVLFGISKTAIQNRIADMRGRGWLVASDESLPVQSRALALTPGGWAALRDVADGRRCAHCGELVQKLKVAS